MSCPLWISGNVKNNSEHLFILNIVPYRWARQKLCNLVYVCATYMTAKWCECCKALTWCNRQNKALYLNKHAYLNPIKWRDWRFYLCSFMKYVRVMPLGGQCYEEGPFFPTTPRYAVQVGIAKKPDLLLKPDWTAITGVITGLLALLIASVLLTVSNDHPKFLFRGY